MIEFDVWWNSAAADSFRAKNEDMDGEQVRPVWDAAVRAAQAQAPAPVDGDLHTAAWLAIAMLERTAHATDADRLAAADALRAALATSAPAVAHANDCWTIISPHGKAFTGETPFRAANEANKHIRATDPAKAKEFADMLERLRAENEAENARLLAEHGTLNCPTCGGSGHIGDVQAPAVVAELPPPAFVHRHEDVCGNEVGPPTNYYSEAQMRAALAVMGVQP